MSSLRRLHRRPAPLVRAVTAAAATAAVVAAGLAAAAPAAATPTSVTLPANAVHDAAYTGRYFLTSPTAARATNVVLQRVVAATFTQNPSATAAAVEGELGTLRSALVGSDGDLRRFGPTTPQQVAGAIGVLLSTAQASAHAGVTTAADAQVAADLYRDYLGGAGDGYGDDLDEYAGAITDPTVGDAGVHDSAGSVFGAVEQDALGQALLCARRNTACAGVVDWLQQATTGVSVTASAASLASDPTVSSAFSTLGLTVHSDGTATGTLDAATSGAITMVGQVRTATGQITGYTDGGGFHPGEVATLDAMEPTLAGQQADPSKRQSVIDAAKSFLGGPASLAWPGLMQQATIAVNVLGWMAGATASAVGFGVKAVGATLSGVMKVFGGAVDLIGDIATSGAVSSLGKATVSLAEGNIIGAISDVFGMFSSPQPDPVYVAVQQLQQQVSDLQKGMETRFDRVDAELGDLMTQVQQGLGIIDTVHDQLTGDFASTWQQIAAVQASVNRLSQQVTEYFSDSIRASTQALIDHYDSFAVRYDHAMTADQFTDAESGLFTAATTNSAQAAVAGDFGYATDDVSVANQLGAYPLDKVRTWLDLFHRRWSTLSPAGTATMVNPDDWARAALGYRQLLDENPQSALAIPSSRLSALASSGAATQQALTGLAANSDGSAPLVDTVYGNLVSATSGLSAALDADANRILGTTAKGLDPWGGSEQAVNPAVTLDARCAQPGSPSADDPSLANRAVPNGLRVAAQAGIAAVAICWAQGGYDEIDNVNCHIVRGDDLCSSTMDYRRSATVQYSLQGGPWTTLTTLTVDYGRYTYCSDNPGGADPTCWPDSRYIPAWSQTTRDQFLANATRVTDASALGALEAANTGFLVGVQKSMYSAVATDLANGALTMPAGYADAGADAAKAQSGAFVLARAATVLASPSSASGDELVRTALWGGPEQLPNNATADGSAGGPVYQRLVAAAANPPATRAGAWSDWLTAGVTRAGQARDQVDATMRTLAAAGYRDRSVLIATVLARLTAGDQTLHQTSWSVTPAAVRLNAPAAGSTASQTLVFTNTSNGVSVKPKSFTVVGTTPDVWTVDANTCTKAVRPGKTCRLTITFHPKSRYKMTDNLKLPVAPDGVGPVVVNLQGTVGT